MKKINKILTTLLPIVISPIVVVSCTIPDKSNKAILPQKPETDPTKDKNKTKLPNPNSKTDKVTNDLTHNFQLNGKKIVVKDDMSILTAKNYNGKINPNSLKGDYVQVGNKKWSWTKNSIMMGKEDSIIYLFDQDDSDGLSVSNFAKTHFLKDTSAASGLKDYYSSLKDQSYIYANWSLYVPFDNATKSLKTYFGSQTNHGLTSKEGKTITTVEEAIKYLEEQKVEAAIISKLKEYYATASHAFKPVVIPKKLIEYKQIAKNAIKVTFHPYNGFSMTAAGLATIKEGQTKPVQQIGPLSIGGPNEWSAYNKNPYNNAYLGTKFVNTKLVVDIYKDQNNLSNPEKIEIPLKYCGISLMDALSKNADFKVSKFTEFGRSLINYKNEKLAKDGSKYYWSMNDKNNKAFALGGDSLLIKVKNNNLSLVKTKIT